MRTDLQKRRADWLSGAYDDERKRVYKEVEGSTGHLVESLRLAQTRALETAEKLDTAKSACAAAYARGVREGIEIALDQLVEDDEHEPPLTVYRQRIRALLSTPPQQTDRTKE